MIYIDALVYKRQNGRTLYAHLSSPSRKELEQFARRIGLKPCFRHAVRKHAHYDVPERLYTEAIRAGAEVVSSRKLIEICFGQQ